MTFQVARSLRDLGVLKAIHARAPRSSSAEELAADVGLTLYGVTVLLECGLGGGIVSLGDDDRWSLSKTGWLIEHDAMTRANMDFVQEVCWKPMLHLDAAIREGKPSGLAEIGEGKVADGETVYDALAGLPDKTREAWLRFDHFYSDGAFERALDVVLASKPARLVDLGANTGKFARAILARDEALEMTLADLPGQLGMARSELDQANLLSRATFHPLDVREPDAKLPAGVDAVWMSQFLVCFSLEQVEAILAKARAALAPGGSVWILDTFWDRQRHDIAAFCLVSSSPYFTAVANGVSRMYRATEIEAAARRAGLVLTEATDGLGLSHSLLRFSAS